MTPEIEKDSRQPAIPRWLRQVVGRLECHVLELLVKRCRHDSNYVSADILEGGMNNGYTQLQLCRRCGAVRFVFGDHCAGETLRYQEWRRPRPLWVKPSNNALYKPSALK